MNVYELVEKVGGEIVRGNARVRLGFGGAVDLLVTEETVPPLSRDRSGPYVILGRLNGDDMVFTEAGRYIAGQYTLPEPKTADAPAEPKLKAKAARPGRKAAPKPVEEKPAVSDEELSDVLKELDLGGLG